MRHRIVAAKLRNTFSDNNSGNRQSVVDVPAPEFTCVFYGEHALSGERRTAGTMSLWWQRISGLFPGAGSEPLEIVVSGGRSTGSPLPAARRRAPPVTDAYAR